LLYFILDLGVVDQREVELEIIKVVEGLADVPAPVKHVFVKVALYQQSLYQYVSFFFWDNMHDLIKEPDHLRSLGAMVEVKEHFDAFEEEREVKIWGYQKLHSMNMLKPGSDQFHGRDHCETVVS